MDLSKVKIDFFSLFWYNKANFIGGMAIMKNEQNRYFLVEYAGEKNYHYDTREELEKVLDDIRKYNNRKNESFLIGNMSANNRPFSLKATKKTQKVNLQPVLVDGKKVRLSTKEIRTIKKNK